MWCRWGTTITAVTFGVTASLVSYEFATNAQNQAYYYYTPSQLRAVLKGFGYNVPQVGGALTDQATVSAIRDFQRIYELKVDGAAGPNTQKLVAEEMRNLQGSLNLVVKPKPPLPRNQLYTPETGAAVRQFQTQFNLPVTGIATLEVRSRLDQEAKRVLGEPSTKPTPTPRQSPAPRRPASPSPTPSTSPSARPSPTPSTSPSASPGAVPEVSPSSSPAPRSSP